jgi:hypothetical protein
MRRGYKILIVSAILFASAIAVFFTWGIAFSNLFLSNTQSLSTSQVTIRPLESHNATIDIENPQKVFTLTIDSINNDQIKLREVVIGPNGKAISNATFQKSYFAAINPNSTGEYRLSISNLDRDSAASIYMLFGNLPFIKENGEIDPTSFAGLIIGMFLFIGGIISFAIGVILSLKDRNREKFSRGFIPR